MDCSGCPFSHLLWKMHQGSSHLKVPPTILGTEALWVCDWTEHLMLGQACLISCPKNPVIELQGSELRREL